LPSRSGRPPTGKPGRADCGRRGRLFGGLDEAALFEDGDVYRVGYDEERASKALVRVAIIGAGGVAQARHLPALQQLRSWWEPVDVVGLSVRDPRERRQLAGTWGLATFATPEELLRETTPEAVIVASSDEVHAEHTLAALEAGCHVLVEKPIATSMRDAARMTRTAEERGRVLATVANKRYSPPYVEAKRLLDSGELPAPRLLSGKFTLGYRYLDLLDNATIHLIDLARYFLGEVVEVSAASPERLPGKTATGASGPIRNIAITLRYQSGAVGSLVTSSSATSVHPWERVEIYGDHAWVDVEDQSSVSFYPSESEPAQTWEQVLPSTLFTAAEWGGFTGLIADFLGAVRGQPMVRADSWDGYRAYEIAAATRLSLGRHAPVSLPLDPVTADREIGDYRPPRPRRRSR
jgi:predicted dehydrogenase